MHHPIPLSFRESASVTLGGREATTHTPLLPQKTVIALRARLSPPLVLKGHPNDSTSFFRCKRFLHRMASTEELGGVPQIPRTDPTGHRDDLGTHKFLCGSVPICSIIDHISIRLSMTSLPSHSARNTMTPLPSMKASGPTRTYLKIVDGLNSSPYKSGHAAAAR